MQRIPVSLETAWNFFSNPKNLQVITPSFLNLKMTNELDSEKMYTGQVMTYRVKPLLGIPVFWKTEITYVEPCILFIDEQRKGPYKLWHHQHHFKQIDGGVEMTDIVQYSLPLGVLGNIAHPLLVKSRLKDIFTYRYFKINELFGDWPDSRMNLEID